MFINNFLSNFREVSSGVYFWWCVYRSASRGLSHFSSPVALDPFFDVFSWFPSSPSGSYSFCYKWGFEAYHPRMSPVSTVTVLLTHSEIYWTVSLFICWTVSLFISPIQLLSQLSPQVLHICTCFWQLWPIFWDCGFFFVSSCTNSGICYFFSYLLYWFWLYSGGKEANYYLLAQEVL